MAEDIVDEDKMAEDEVAKGPNYKRTIWQEDQKVNENDWRVTGEGLFGKRTNWSMAEMVKDQMLEDEMAKDEMGKDEMAKDEMGKDEVAW